jgi:hypothetical protein
LRALIQDTSFCANVVNENINFSQGKRWRRLVYGC